MTQVGAVYETKQQPAPIEFSRKPVEDAFETQKQGRYVAKDVDFVRVFIVGTKDWNDHRVDRWFKTLEMNVAQDRIPREWLNQYRRLYEAWKNGQELPLNGTPVRGWGIVSPAQQENLCRLHILTVEDVAAMNDDTMRRVGMGASELKSKAKAWLDQVNDKGPLAVRMAALEQENTLLRACVASLEGQKAELVGMVEALQNSRVAVSLPDVSVPDASINLMDIVPEREEIQRPEKPKKAQVTL